MNDFCTGIWDDCPHGGCDGCDESVYGQWEGNEDCAMESSLFGDC